MSVEQPKVTRQEHWERIYRAKDEHELSWHQSEPRVSLNLIGEVMDAGARVIDVGGGASVLAARVLDAGAGQVTVLDISEAALKRARQRIGSHADRIEWVVGDVTKVEDLGTFDVWHDRAVFHFLIDPEDRRKYVALVERSIEPGGYAIIATFGPDGPERCSGLPVQRYTSEDLAQTFGKSFRLQKHESETHETPWGKPQQFAYMVLQKVG